MALTEHIGIVACSAEGAALCYRTICAEGPAVLGAHAHPEVTMHTYPLSEYMRSIYADDWSGVADLMVSSVKKLATAGATLQSVRTTRFTRRSIRWCSDRPCPGCT
ncbi:MAG: hypothetical protein U0105_02325 [Candidatus Obscuribacterales bacterium]